MKTLLGKNKILVTGAAGFIGSHLCEFLLANGENVIGVDNLSVGSIKNLAISKKSTNFVFIEDDVNKLEKYSSDLSEVKIIFHLAALADIVPSIEKPTDYFNSNVNGTMKILELARNLEVQKFIYTASSSCYGIPKKLPTSELETISTEYPYALSKYLGELLCLHWFKVYKLPVLSFRLFNVYGPRARTSGTYGAVFGVFLAQKLSGFPLTVVGDGTQTRDFTYVDDVVRALSIGSKSKINGEVFNVGSGGTYSINSLVELLGSPKVNIPKRPGEPDSTFADISKIKRMLNWQPTISFENGVKKLLSNIEDWKNAPVWTPEKIADATKLWFDNLSK
jgi:UDP-glucose 4-epimerase